MIDLAEMARRSPQPVQHWIMSWREGEQPTPAQADEAVKMFLDEMGLADHQAHLRAPPRHPQLAPPPGRQPRPPRDGEARHRQQGLRPRGRPPGDRPHRAAPGLAARGAGALRAGRAGRDQARQAPGTTSVSPRPGPVTSRSASGARSAERIAIEDAAPIIRRARELAGVARGARRSRGCGSRRRARARFCGSATNRSRPAPPAATARCRRSRSGSASSSRHLARSPRRPLQKARCPAARSCRRPCWRPTSSSAASLRRARQAGRVRAIASAPSGASSSSGIGRSAPTSSAARGRGRATSSTRSAASPPPARRRRRPSCVIARSCERAALRAGPRAVPVLRRVARALRPRRGRRVAPSAAASRHHRGRDVRPADAARHPRRDAPSWTAGASTTTSPAPQARLPSPIAARPSTSTTAATARRSWPRSS